MQYCLGICTQIEETAFTQGKPQHEIMLFYTLWNSLLHQTVWIFGERMILKPSGEKEVERKNLVIDFKPEGHDQNTQFILMRFFLKWFMPYSKVATWSENNKLSTKSHGEHFIIKLHHLLEKYPAFIPATLSLFFCSVCALSVYWMVQSIVKVTLSL